MDTARRTLAKALTWQLLGLVTTTALGYAATGSLTAGGALALSSALVGFICYAVHERLWSRIRWGRIFTQNDQSAT
ncbi:DUF2061 domain-containing protein [Maritimibacter sp. UBA3975]|uniref:DUF2061 domain-containing protein n=1 Tax=Maritimibacter sp. UBA3975 TaxID=1946833 RepID=UPI000C09CE94|nr:DUF2061 domain-containing protein [Maritimibacter sp. UBA3975]MAM62297.1 hypothetical protein [Maritimibacter sp.]|tara:strand:+ start:9215 stop:9442 length:228 start_codon:yes stop_codon:yes gene_type:complete